MDTSKYSMQDKTILANWCEMAEIAETSETSELETRQQAQIRSLGRSGSRIDSPCAENGSLLNIVRPAANTASITQIESSKLLPWMMLACLLSGIAIGMLIVIPSFIESKVQAGSAKAEAIASTAETHARVALDKVEDFRTKLAEKGVNITLDGH